MLVERRRQLGLTIEQASHVLKIKPAVLVAFEEGDFLHIPKSGYAQGMLSSYARYLGMNPRSVVDQFCEDLFEYQNGSTSHELRRRTRGSRASLGGDEPTQARRESPRPAATTSSTLSGNDPYQASSAPKRRSQVLRNPNGDWSYNSEQSPSSRTTDATQRYSSSIRYRDGSAASQRPSSRNRQQPANGRPGVARRQPGPRGGTLSPSLEPGRVTTHREDISGARVHRRGPSYASDEEIITRTVNPQVRDDLQYDDARPYNPASTSTGRRYSRNIASTDRPNVRRRGYQSQNSSAGRGPRSRQVNQQQGGSSVAAFFRNFFSDSTRTIVTILAALALILILIIIGSIRSCASASSNSGKKVSVTTATSSTAAASTSSDEQKSAEQQALSDAAAKSAAAASTQAITETDVKVTVADGAVTWVEIVNDGESKVAETITGPWEQSYVVTKSISIQVGDTSNVTVTNNGEQVQFDKKASGVGTISITGTQVPASTADATASTDAAATTSTGDAEGSSTTG